MWVWGALSILLHVWWKDSLKLAGISHIHLITLVKQCLFFLLAVCVCVCVCACLCVCVYVLVAQLCLTLCNPVDCSPQASLSIEFSRQGYWNGLPFSRGSSQPRDWTWVSCIAGRLFTIWATREAALGYKFGKKNFFFFPQFSISPVRSVPSNVTCYMALTILVWLFLPLFSLCLPLSLNTLRKPRA